MSLGLRDQYILAVRFGDNDVPVNTSTLKECTIVKDIRKFLPEFRFCIQDTSDVLSHTIPFDKSMSRVNFKISTTLNVPRMDFYDFIVYRKESVAEGPVGGTYDIRGLLNVKNLNAPNYTRSFNTTIDLTLRTIGQELGISYFEISPSLNFEKKIIQPNWTNAQLLIYLSETLVGLNGESNYRVFVKVVETKKILVFKTLTELINSPIKNKYVASDNAFQDHKPIYNWEILNNYKYLGTLGCRSQKYSYFNYTLGEFIEKELTLDNVVGLAENNLVDKEDNDEGLSYNSTGRNNDHSLEFQGVINSIFETRVNDLVKMWLITDGDLNVDVGNVVKIIFPQGFNTGKVFSYQYAGYWLIERIVFHFDDAFRMHLLLTRNGIEAEPNTISLIPAKIVRK